jgi:type IV secretory pathway TrbD component
VPWVNLKEDAMRGTPALYFQSLNRPFTVLGVDRALFYLFVGLCLPIAFSGRLMPLMDLLAGLIFMGLYGMGVLITRVDPQMLLIYRRHIHYRAFYAAAPGLHAPIHYVKPSVPFYQGKRGLL